MVPKISNGIVGMSNMSAVDLSLELPGGIRTTPSGSVTEIGIHGILCVRLCGMVEYSCRCWYSMLILLEMSLRF